jgi:hypothetical protein
MINSVNSEADMNQVFSIIDYEMALVFATDEYGLYVEQNPSGTVRAKYKKWLSGFCQSDCDLHIIQLYSRLVETVGEMGDHDKFLHMASELNVYTRRATRWAMW